MKREVLAVALFAGFGLAMGSVAAGPTEDLKIYQAYFEQRFPEFTPEDYTQGMYNFNEDKRAQWEAIMEFPPYEMAVEEGQELFETPFKNGNSYASCFENGGIGIAQTYPRFDPERGKVMTLGMAINDCRVKNGEEPLDMVKGPLVYIEAYMAETSRGKPIDITVPDDPRALAAYEEGKRIYFTRHGPRAFACYHCHWEAAGGKIRGNELSPAIGQAANFPAYRSKWGEMGSIQRRFKGCMENIGAKPLKPGGEDMANLEYFHRRLSNAIPLSAPNNRF
ncbi:MAG: sulfur oxidation c-type cytochrome SoxA [Gammaproteobacteria bacterium]|jgi:sulfur-oxidizing protein SoxA